jgi:hypothetical protein
VSFAKSSRRAALCLLALSELVAEGVAVGKGIGVVDSEANIFQPIDLYVSSRLLASSAAVSSMDELGVGSTGSFGSLSDTVGVPDAASSFNVTVG